MKPQIEKFEKPRCEFNLQDLSSRPDEVSDEEIVNSFVESRNASDFERLVHRYVFQATFLSVHLRIDQFEKGRRFRPWLYAIASNKAIDYLRRNRRHQAASLDAKFQSGDSDESMITQLEGNVAAPDDVAIVNETSARVRAAVEELSGPTQQLIQLAFYQGMKYSDIAEVLQIPLGTVKSRVFTAIRKLNQIWLRMNESSQTNNS
jgi:RNA polymerase sigma-70 factor, ECF subfamily